MKVRPAYFVINTGTRPTVKRVSQKWPPLRPGEIVVRLALDIPDDLMPNAQIIEIDDPDYVAVAIVGSPAEPPTEEDTQ